MRNRTRESSQSSLQKSPLRIHNHGRRLRVTAASRKTTIKVTLNIDHLFAPDAMDINSTDADAVTDIMPNYFCAVRDIVALMNTIEEETYPTGSESSRIDALGMTLVAGLADVRKWFRLEYDLWQSIVPLLSGMDENGHGLRISRYIAIVMQVSTAPGRGDKGKAEFTRLSNVCSLRRLAVMEDGHFGLVPWGSKEGDEVFAFEGMESLFVLRSGLGRVGDDRAEEFELVGDCYVHGLEAAVGPGDGLSVDLT
ncbi:hypothetical protein B0T24DRAFT_632294 [Lasiosphaeria ovina]|uniref:Uncharacterized protein n=1 Tax=Lasiosphaeria ovina TaxID=92902 RepID=A0AAE0K482_9PEZI|nr:hypothetical protein B0T24DRAFT_632294 [Lasiosphaeria ovina]